MENTTQQKDQPVLEPLTVELFRQLWSKTYDTQGKPDWSHIFPYYHDQIVFEDSIQRIEGIEEFKSLCNRLTKRCEQINMDILSVVKEGQEIFFQWKMQMMFRNWPSTPIFGCTKLTLAADSRIIHQRDYFDLWGDIINGIPRFRRLYRKFMHKYFG
jgi:limonene-1,2-epoxide hydrolase